ncbi:HNH endonuclease [Aspergillus ibericus CBS 121593]|uniref:HNH domain-containing protein n=1 Tax=Aspergillus ibericus CBS 121593 TaxID=1448316 RepID=A0A395GWJ6_9EURO|nr:hypothetical protein BO80DRAFT_437058 [Aspergillus ibericus CBS 121593]RAK98433.1 hypothetical protein BO80DRAFT_437058 [Aspergillus ibericus CBS 121593]
MTTPDSENYQIFRDCVSSAIVAKSSQPTQSKKARRPRTQRQKTSSTSTTQRANPDPTPQDDFTRTDPEDLADFIDFIANETFPSLPPHIQTLQYTPTIDITTPEYTPKHLSERTAHILDPSIPDTLTAYGLIDTPGDIPSFLAPILSEYVNSVTKPPPVWANTRASACEICERDWIPLSYHHLIPKSVHAKVLKKGWHEEWRLDSVAWLCRACHSFVHRMASNEELAREWFTVERIWEREDVRNWAAWVGRVRWKAR